MAYIEPKMDFQDGEVLYGSDLNASNAVIKAGVDDNFDRIQGLDTDKQPLIDEEHKLDYSLIDNTPDIPSKTSDLDNDSGFITEEYHDDTKQDVLTAGEGISIENNVISNTQTSAEWGNIQGDITDQEDLQAVFNDKVDKVEGKDLSTNDYTDEEKSKLEGIASGAEANVIEDIKVNGTSQTVTNKAVDITIPTAVSDLTNDLDFIDNTVDDLVNYTTTTDLNTALNGKADEATTLAGYGITDAYTKTEVDNKVSSVYKYKGSVNKYSDLPSSGQVVGDVYNVETADKTHGIKAGDNVAWNGTTWDVLGGDVDLSDYYTKTQVDTALGDKVDKVSGKQLSTEDYTTSEKSKLDGIATGAEVNVIETIKVDNTALTPSSKAVNIDLSGKINEPSSEGTSGQVLTTDGNGGRTWTTVQGGGGGGTTDYDQLSNRPQINSVTLTGNKSLSDLGINIPTKLSDLTNDNNTVTDADYVHTDNNYTATEKTKLSGIEAGAEVNDINTIKVNSTALTPDANKAVDITVPTKISDLTNDNNTVTDASYVHTDNNYTTAEKNKLSGISTGATKTESSTTNGNIKIDGVDVTVYTYPTTTAVSAAAIKVGRDTLGHVVIGSALDKSDVGLGNVVNTGDSATPVENGTTKFTTGGAYTELAKKVDKETGKGLSTEDYTTDEKSKLLSVSSGAMNNVVLVSYISSTTPEDPSLGETWFNLTDNKFYTYAIVGYAADWREGAIGITLKEKVIYIARDTNIAYIKKGSTLVSISEGYGEISLDETNTTDYTKLIIDENDLSYQGSEITNTYSVATDKGYSANYLNNIIPNGAKVVSKTNITSITFTSSSGYGRVWLFSTLCLTMISFDGTNQTPTITDMWGEHQFTASISGNIITLSSLNDWDHYLFIGTDAINSIS